MESLIKLTVRTPNQRFEDLQIDCDLCWTVRTLKEYLENVYPSKPASSSQRLIYLGKLLQDHVSLWEIFNSSEDGNNVMRTLHIVCTDLAESRPASSEDHAATCAGIPASPSRCNLNHEGLRLRSSAQGTASSSELFTSVRDEPASNQSGSQPTTIGSFSGPAGAGIMPNALLWQQQYQYHVQEYMRYLQQWQQHSTLSTMPGASAAYESHPWLRVSGNPGMYAHSPSLSPPATLVSGSAHAPPHPSDNQSAQQRSPSDAAAGRQPVVAAAARAPQNQNARVNAGPGGAVMEEEDDEDAARQHDWLDWLYMLLRVAMLLSVVYFYSSTSRFVLVFLLGFIIYMYQAGYFTPRRHLPARAGAGPAPPLIEGEQLDQMQPDRNRNIDDVQQLVRDAVNGGSIDSARLVVARLPRTNIFRVMCVFFVSFFTSLVPQAPPPMQGN